MELFGLLLLLFSLFSLLPPSSSDEVSSIRETYDPEIIKWAGYGEERLSSVLVTGTVLCEACLVRGMMIRKLPLAGALVGVTCRIQGKRTRRRTAMATTDEYGDFIIDLPSSLHAIPRLEKVCFVRALRLPVKSVCRTARKPTRIRLSSIGNGIRVYTAGFLHTKQQSGLLNVCRKTAKDVQEKKTW